MPVRFKSMIISRTIHTKSYHSHPTGALSTAGALDREYQSQYEVQVVVTDGDLFTVTPVYVTVSDVNDNVPQFMENLYRISVPRRQAARRRSPVARVSCRTLRDILTCISITLTLFYYTQRRVLFLIQFPLCRNECD